MKALPDYTISPTKLKLAALKQAKECCVLIREARQLSDENLKSSIIKQAVDKMHQATLMNAEARRIEVGGLND